MKPRAFAICVAAIGMLPLAANAGAWTQDSGHVQIIMGSTVSRATSYFDNAGIRSGPIVFDKTLTNLYAEYGLRNGLTLILAPEYVRAQSNASGGGLQNASDWAFEGGLRARLFHSFGVLSLQGTAKSAGAFDMSVSANGRTKGRQLELRLLYGTNFKLLGLDGFADAEIGHRWIAGPRPNETPVDLTLGLSLAPRLKLLAQSFNIVASGDAKPPYTYYRTHKLQLSMVLRLRHQMSIQLGAFVSPAGQNSLTEEGLVASTWISF
jgi:protein XagA